MDGDLASCRDLEDGEKVSVRAGQEGALLSRHVHVQLMPFLDPTVSPQSLPRSRKESC